MTTTGPQTILATLLGLAVPLAGAKLVPFIFGQPAPECISVVEAQRFPFVGADVVSPDPFYVNNCPYRLQVMTCEEGGTKVSCGLFEMEPLEGIESPPKASFRHGYILAVCKGEYRPFNNYGERAPYLSPRTPAYICGVINTEGDQNVGKPIKGEWWRPETP